MCIFHKWTKWEQYDMEMLTIDKTNGEKIEHLEERQKRHCEKCNYKVG